MVSCFRHADDAHREDAQKLKMLELNDRIQVPDQGLPIVTPTSPIRSFSPELPAKVSISIERESYGSSEEVSDVDIVSDKGDDNDLN